MTRRSPGTFGGYLNGMDGDVLDLKEKLRRKAEAQKQKSREKVENVFTESMEVMSQDPGMIAYQRKMEAEIKANRLKQGGQKFRVRQIVHFFDRERIPWDGIVVSANYRDFDIDGPGWYYEVKWIDTKNQQTHEGYNHQDDLTP